MNTVDAQIKTAYEQEGMTPREIAEDQQFSEIAVKAKLMQISSAYRKACGHEEEEEDDLNFTNDQLRIINKKIFENAISAQLPDGSPDYKTSQRACEYIRDDKKGRKEVVKQVAGNTFNILQWNQENAQAEKRAEKLRQLVTHNAA